MRNKIVIKNRKFRFVFRNVEAEKFKKIYNYLLDTKKKPEVVEPKLLVEPKEEPVVAIVEEVEKEVKQMKKVKLIDNEQEVTYLVEERTAQSVKNHMEKYGELVKEPEEEVEEEAEEAEEEEEKK